MMKDPNNEKETSQTSQNERRELLRAISFLSQIGITMAACVLVGVLLGRFLDNFFGTSPWLLIIFSFLGMAAAFKALFDLGGV